MKNRTYIAGPITGREYTEYRAHFQKEYEKLHLAGRNPVSPVGLSEIYPDFDHAEIMKVCLAVLENCSSIHMLRGWEKSKGARMEINRAIEMGLSVTYEKESRRNNENIGGDSDSSHTGSAPASTNYREAKNCGNMEIDWKAKNHMLLPGV